MSCANKPAELEAYADGELDVEHDVDAIANIANHLVTCAECRAEVASIRQVSASLRQHLPRYEASDMLRARVGALVKQSFAGASQPSAARDAVSTSAATSTVVATPSSAPGNKRLRTWKTFALAASVLLAAVTTHDLMGFRSARSTSSSLNQELINAHVRSLMLDHLVDVPSSDRHTVKPWFEGKVNFSPSVFDFASDSFPLAGGRLDYATGHPTAVIVFHRGQHAINLFVWASDSADANIRTISQNGFNISSWRRSGLQYSAVSSLNRTSLAQFANLYVARDSTTDAVQR